MHITWPTSVCGKEAMFVWSTYHARLQNAIFVLPHIICWVILDTSRRQSGNVDLQSMLLLPFTSLIITTNLINIHM